MPNLIGTAPNQVPVNGLLGTLAFQDSNSVTISGGNIGGVPVSTIVDTVLRGEQVDTIASSSSVVLRGGATNLLTYSEQIDNAAWTKTNSTVTLNSIVAPDGTLTGDKVVEDTTGGFKKVSSQPFSSGLTSGISYTFSVYIKTAGRTWTVLEFQGAFGGGYAWFDVANGVIGSQVNLSGTSTITPVGNGWYRCSITDTSTGTGSGTSQVNVYVSTNNSVTTYTGDGTSGAYVWGAQLEASSTAGAYLKTEATAVSTAYAAPIESPNGVAVPLLASMTPARNGDMTFQLTSNTSLTIKVKGSDGTVRSVALTLA